MRPSPRTPIWASGRAPRRLGRTHDCRRPPLLNVIFFLQDRGPSTHGYVDANWLAHRTKSLANGAGHTLIRAAYANGCSLDGPAGPTLCGVGIAGGDCKPIDGPWGFLPGRAEFARVLGCLVGAADGEVVVFGRAHAKPWGVWGRLKLCGWGEGAMAARPRSSVSRNPCHDGDGIKPEGVYD